MLEFLGQPVFQRLALTLLHFLWQGAAIAIVLGIALWKLDRRGPRARYAACMIALAAVVALPAATFCLVPSAEHPSAGHREPVSAEPLADRSDVAPNRGVRPASTRDAVDGLANRSARSADSRRDAQLPFPFVAAATPYLVSVWMLGVLAYGLRLLCGFAGTRRLLRDRVALPGELLATVRELSRTMRLASSPLVCGSRRVAEAMAVGFFRPVVLLPVSWLADVPPDVLRSVLAHELAHVRRWDRWINLLQRVVEAVLFYHPAVWWVSRRMRAEREFCCDDEAARAVGGAVRYAEALEHIGRLHWNQRQFLLTNPIGGTKMALLKRVRRVLGMSESNWGRDGWTVGLLAVAVPLMLLVASAWWPSGNSGLSAAVADDGNRDRDKAEKRERDDDSRAANRRETKEGEQKERDDRREGDRRERKGEDRQQRGENRDGDRRERKSDARPETNRREAGERRERGERDNPARRERGERRDGDPRREGDKRRNDDERRRKVLPDQERARGRREGQPRREGDRPQPANIRQLMQIIRDLQSEVRQLRREVQELKGRRPDRPRGDRGGARRPIPRREGDRPRGNDYRPRGDRRPENVPRRREGEKRRDGEQDRPAF
jgi:bla regulator protein blaR1